MKVIKPSVILEHCTPNVLRVIEAAARTCYKSEDVIDLNDDTKCKAFVKSLIDRKHESTIEHAVASFRIITNRGVLAELTRHRLASYSVESTRYCNYSKDKFDNEITIIQPATYDTWDTTLQTYWRGSMVQAEQSYFDMLRLGAKPQEARGVLPNDLKTEIVMTANFREWRNVLKQRLSTGAHPDIQVVMKDVHRLLKEQCPVVFDNLE